MKNAKKILVTTVSSEVLIVRRGATRKFREFCTQCRVDVEILPLGFAVEQSGKSARTLFELVESGAIHAIQTTGGHLFICKNSLNI